MNRSAVISRSNPRTDGCTATCCDCDWITNGGPYDSYGNIQKRVRNHVSTLGHRVVLTKTCTTVYEPMVLA